MAGAGGDYRAQVGEAAYHLISRQATKSLDEKLGSKDWRRLRGEWLNASRSAGPDFEKALLFSGNIPAAADYTDAMVLDDSEAGAPETTLYHARQRALLAWIVNALPAESESAKLIKDCVHAGGRLGPRVGPPGLPQALMLLDTRWMDAAPVEGKGDVSRRLFKERRWPSTYSAEAYVQFYNAVVADANLLDINPSDDTEASVSLRSMWWHLFAQPPEGSPYYKAAAEARTVTQHRDSLVADREAFRAAMIKSIAMVPATRPPPATGLSRPAAHARLAELATTALMDRGESAEDVCQVAAVFSATATKSAMPEPYRPPTRPCPRCPLRDGKPVLHPVRFKCEAEVECDICMSNMHASHSCFIKSGIPAGVKMNPVVSTEVERLHGLYVKGKFDSMTTPTTLRWLLGARRRAEAGQALKDASSADVLLGTMLADEFALMEGDGCEDMSGGGAAAVDVSQAAVGGGVLAVPPPCPAATRV